MNTSLVNVKKKIIGDFDHVDESNYWKTLSEISDDTNIEIRDVIRLVFTEPEFAMSTYRRKDGEPVFTTRKAFGKYAPFNVKFWGAMKNTID